MPLCGTAVPLSDGATYELRCKRGRGRGRWLQVELLPMLELEEGTLEAAAY